MKNNNDTAPAGALATGPIPVDRIRPDPKNRKEFDPVELAALAKSIEADGLLNPIIVCKVGPLGSDPKKPIDFQIIAGERRWRAHQLLKREHIMATIHEANEEAKIITRKRLAENFHRADLTPIEKARDLQQLIADGMSQDEVAAFVGAKDQSTVSNFLRLLALPPEVQAMVQRGELNAAQAKGLLRFSKWPAACEMLAKEVIRADMSSKAVETANFDWEIQTKMEKKGLLAKVYTGGFSPSLAAEVEKDPAYMKMGYGRVCFEPAKWKALVERKEAAEKTEKSENAKRAASTRTAKPTDNGAQIQPDREIFAALIPEAKLVKKKGSNGAKYLCLDSNLWGKISGKANELIEADAEKKITALVAEAIEQLRKVKVIEARFATVLYADQQCEFEGFEPAAMVGLLRKRLALRDGDKIKKCQASSGHYSMEVNFAQLAGLCDATELLKLQIGARLDALATGCGEVDEKCDLLRVVLGRPSLGLLMDSPEGRAALLVTVAKELKLALPGVPSPASAKAATPEKGVRAQINDEVRSEVRKYAEAGKTGAEIAKLCGISLPSVQNIKKALGLVKAKADAKRAAKKS